MSRPPTVDSLHQAGSLISKVLMLRALKRPLLNTYDSEAGWQELAPGRVAIFDIPSSHEGMFQKPCVSHLAEKLKRCLG